MPEFRKIDVGRVSLRVAVEGGGPLVIMVHGFPESWYSWRHQMSPIAAAGFTACAIDVRGYGGSDKPHDVGEYTLENLSGDVAGLIDRLSPDTPAVVVGHDWGAPIVWTTALVHPDKVRAVAGLSVPYLGIPKVSLNDVIDRVYTREGRFFYMHYFAQEGLAEREMEIDVRSALRRFYYAWSGDAPPGTWPLDKKVGDTLLTRVPDPSPFPAWLSEEDIDYFVNEFRTSGFRGGLNRYRNHDRDFAFLQNFKGRKIEQPALYIGGDKDHVLSMFGDRLHLMTDELRSLRSMHIIPGCGHWTQQERARDVNEKLVAWLRSL